MAQRRSQTTWRSVDERLRFFGYRIAQRRGDNEAWWVSPGNELVSQSTALEEISAVQERDRQQLCRETSERADKLSEKPQKR